MKLNLVFVPTKSKAADVTIVPLEDIPDEVVTTLEEAYEHLKTHPGHVRGEFTDEAEALLFMSYAVSYCTQRPDGPIRFRKSPTRNTPKNIVDFRITDVPTDDELEAARKAKAAKAAAKASASA